MSPRIWDTFITHILFVHLLTRVCSVPVYVRVNLREITINLINNNVTFIYDSLMYNITVFINTHLLILGSVVFTQATASHVPILFLQLIFIANTVVNNGKPGEMGEM